MYELIDCMFVFGALKNEIEFKKKGLKLLCRQVLRTGYLLRYAATGLQYTSIFLSFNITISTLKHS